MINIKRQTLNAKIDFGGLTQKENRNETKWHDMLNGCFGPRKEKPYVYECQNQLNQFGSHTHGKNNVQSIDRSIDDR